MVLTPEQQDGWKRDGFLVYSEPLLSPEEVAVIGQRILDIAGGTFPDLPAEVFREEGAVAAGARAVGGCRPRPLPRDPVLTQVRRL